MLKSGTQREAPIDLTMDDDDDTTPSTPHSEQHRANLIKQWNARKEPPVKPQPIAGGAVVPTSNDQHEIAPKPNQHVVEQSQDKVAPVNQPKNFGQPRQAQAHDVPHNVARRQNGISRPSWGGGTAANSGPEFGKTQPLNPAANPPIPPSTVSRPPWGLFSTVGQSLGATPQGARRDSRSTGLQSGQQSPAIPPLVSAASRTPTTSGPAISNHTVQSSQTAPVAANVARPSAPPIKKFTCPLPACRMEFFSPVILDNHVAQEHPEYRAALNAALGNGAPFSAHQFSQVPSYSHSSLKCPYPTCGLSGWANLSGLNIHVAKMHSKGPRIEIQPTRHQETGASTAGGRVEMMSPSHNSASGASTPLYSPASAVGPGTSNGANPLRLQGTAIPSAGGRAEATNARQKSASGASTPIYSPASTSGLAPTSTASASKLQDISASTEAGRNRPFNLATVSGSVPSTPPYSPISASGPGSWNVARPSRLQEVATPTAGREIAPVTMARPSSSGASAPTYAPASASGQGFKRAADGSVKVGDANSNLRFREYDPQASSALKTTHVPNNQNQLRLSNTPTDGQTNVTAATKSTTSTKSHASNATTARLVAAVSAQAPGGPFSPEEDQLLIHLKEVLDMTWQTMHAYFPTRPTWNSLQVHYSTKLKKRDPDYKWVEDSSPAQPGVLRRSKRAAQTSRPHYVVPPLEDTIASIEAEQDPVQSLTPTIQQSMPNTARAPSNLNFTARSSEGQYFIVANGAIDESVTEMSAALRPAHHHRFKTPTRLWRETLNDEHDRNTAAIASMTLKITRAPEPVAMSKQSGPRTGLLRQTSRTKKRSSIQILKPYLGSEQRSFLRKILERGQWDIYDAKPWIGEALHVDFTPTETQLLQESVETIMPDTATKPSRSQIQSIAARAVSDGPFLNRTMSSIESYLLDVRSGSKSTTPMMTQLLVRRTGHDKDHLLRRREKGLERSNNTTDALHTKMIETFGPTHQFRGTSGDVNVLTWAPNGATFAVGCAALTDPNSMQYNRPNNLLIGDVESFALRELPQHASARPKGAGINATSEMRASQDPLLFSTISCIIYSTEHPIMLTAGYDDAVRLWQLGSGLSTAQCRYKVPCGAPVEAMATGPNGMFAAAVRSTENAVKVYRYEVDNGSPANCRKVVKLSSPSAKASPDAGITPSCLRWGSGIQSPRYLLGGFTSKDDDQRRGEACLWDLMSEDRVCISMDKRSVFDITWSPSVFGRFAIGCSAGDTKAVNKGTKSVVRIYDSRSLGYAQGKPLAMDTNSHRTFELECAAWDMNDVVINHYDENLVSAGCTDGSLYMWDLRSPDTLLHRLEHGQPLVELGDASQRENVDLGVRFLSWDTYGRNVYTGSSDGVVATWDPYRATENAHQRDVVKMDSGIMAGAFCPDSSRLLVGDVQGSVLMLGIGEEDNTIADAAAFDFHPASQAERTDVASRLNLDPDQSNAYTDLSNAGVTAARDLIRSAQIELKPLGDFPKRQAVRGPGYRGPYDKKPGADELRNAAREFQRNAALNEDDPSASNRRQTHVFHDEDVFDNGDWKSRIPQEMQRLSATGPIRCLRCSGDRLRIPELPEGEDPTKALLQCPDCDCVWRAETLDYTLVSSGSGKTSRRESSSKPNSTRESTNSNGFRKERRQRLKKSRTLEHYSDLWEVDRVALLGA